MGIGADAPVARATGCPPDDSHVIPPIGDQIGDLLVGVGFDVRERRRVEGDTTPRAGVVCDHHVVSAVRTLTAGLVDDQDATQLNARIGGGDRVGHVLPFAGRD